MPVIEEILQSISDRIVATSDEWGDISVFYNEGEVNPNSDVPCIVIEPQGIIGQNNKCFTDNVRDVKISLYMAESEPRSILRKVWKDL